MKDKETQIAEAKQWLTENAHTPWAQMDLELMEDYAPEKLDRMVAEGTLMQYVQKKNEELTEQHLQLENSGAYNHLSEIGDEMRSRLTEAYLYPQDEWDVMELIDRGLSGEVLTPEQKAFLKERLHPALAREVDLLP